MHANMVYCAFIELSHIRTLWLYNAVNYFTPSLLSQWQDGCSAQLLPVLFPPSSFDALVSMIHVQVTAHVILRASLHCFNRCVLCYICVQHTHIRTHIHTYRYACTHANTHTHTHTNTCTYSCTHTCAFSIIHFTHSLSSISSPNLRVLFSVSSWCTSTLPH